MSSKSAQRVRVYRDRMRRLGLLQRDIWIHRDYVDELKALADKSKLKAKEDYLQAP